MPDNGSMDDGRRVAAVILAAGASKRFGAPKQLADFDGGTMLEAVARTADEAGLRPIIVVTPSRVPVPQGTRRVANDDPDAGLSRSLQLGLAAVPAEQDAAIILLGDQPTVTATHLRRLTAARGDRPVVATAAAGVLAPPVLLERSAFARAAELTGDTGLRELLGEHREVGTIDVPRHAPDVDEPADLVALEEACPGCGARYPRHPTDETHAYIGASPACWAAFGELLAREFGDPAYGWIHRHTVDVYTVQHPGTDDRRQRQSVALHLIGLCHWLEHGMDMRRLNPITQRLASENRDWPWLTPPARYELTVLDALASTKADEHGTIVRHWADAVWDAWSEHHELIRRWAAEVLH
jgi:CTP:molybdopterin cytidylyltransferase MocA